MSNTVIRVENLGKQYRLGQVGTGTISHDLNRWFAKIRGKEDPFLKVGDANDRSKKGNSDLVWALKDINFEVKQGDVLGIIGKNGAGKSTLLKILSRVTSPTVGDIKVKGRIASLLEVGTGFHPELTGRENIFINGAILGMTKREIKAKFDEIVDFSGVERYIDTPVKRYSSGMYVRLAFAVAAHLEPEILVVDEVLAVGDQEFQDKCLGKMKDVSEHGRTVLFVSHNMGAIKSLCKSAMLLQNGTLAYTGKPVEVINTYFSADDHILTDGIIPVDFKRVYNDGNAFFRRINTTNDKFEKKDRFYFRDPINVSLSVEFINPVNDAIIGLTVINDEQEKISYYEYPESSTSSLKFEKGHYDVNINFADNFLPGKYYIRPALFHFNGNTIDYLEKIAEFEVASDSHGGTHNYKWERKHGNSFMNLKNIEIVKR